MSVYISLSVCMSVSFRVCVCVCAMGLGAWNKLTWFDLKTQFIDPHQAVRLALSLTLDVSFVHCSDWEKALKRVCYHSCERDKNSAQALVYHVEHIMDVCCLMSVNSGHTNSDDLDDEQDE